MTETYREFSALLKGGRYREAVALAERELEKSGKADPFWLTQKANALNRSADHQRAYEAAREALGFQPSNPYAVLAAADALLGLHRNEEALSCYKEVAGHEKLGSRARAGIFGSLAHLGRWEELLASLAEAGVAERYPWRVKALRALGRAEEAAAECRLWLTAVPDHPPALWELMELEVAAEGAETVRERYGKLARIPTLPGVYREIYASLCRRAGFPELAMKEYGKIDDAGSGTRLRRQEAFTMAKSGREREAIPLIEELLALEPKDIYLHASYGAACGRVGELDRAMNFYVKLMGMYPEEKGLYGRIRQIKKKLEARSAKPEAGEGSP